jgi:two-component system sensor histidine kinase BaeS
VTRSLFWKFTLVFLVVGLTITLVVAVFMQLTGPGQLRRLVVDQQRTQFLSQLVSYYEAHGSWQGVDQGVRPQGGPGSPGSNFGLADSQGRVVIPMMPGMPLGAVAPPVALRAGEAVKVNGSVVGTILSPPQPPGLGPDEMAYLQRTALALLLASGGALLIALVLGAALARTLTGPLRALTQAAREMAGGKLDQEVRVQSKDEIGDLAVAFNQMSRAVARANLARRQMTADVAHELRTPLTVIAGYVESMRDGVLPPTAERLSVIYQEIEHLQHLVGDLRTLTQADANNLRLNREPVSPGALVQQVRQAFEHQAAQKGVTLLTRVAPDLSPVALDEDRMAQVLDNLVSNALRYTPSDGQVEIAARNENGRLVLTVHDTGPGISAADLPFVFDRFYRADKSRSQESGESGLGLAIAKALVEAHGGGIEVQSAPGNGTTFLINLPAS